MSNDIRTNIENYANYKANLRKECEKKREINHQIKEKLQQTFKKKMLTIAIGIIDKFESFFGNEWGHGIDESNISKEQSAKRDKWQQCRDEILNHANKIIRGIGNDLENYNLDYKNRRV